MSFDVDYWKDDPDAPFAVLLETVNVYCHPENMDWDGLRDLIAHPAKYNAEEDVARFKRELREALEDPNRIPGNATHKTLFRAAEYGDGTDERFLKRLWRELYPDEPVPGGDEEFRTDLIAVMRGEKRLSHSSIRPYSQHYLRSGMSDPEFARMVWQKKYPDEPPPV